MNNFFKVLLSLLITYLSSYSIANANEIKKAEQIVVRVENGTGFIVGNHYIFTAQHVISGKKTFNVKFRNGDTRTAIVINSSESFDVAILKITGKKLSTEIYSEYYFPEKDALEKGDKVFTIGFPSMGTDWQYDDLTFSGPETERLIFSGNVGEGNSGGPLIKGKEIVGVIVEADHGHAYAVPISIIRQFLIGTIPEGENILKQNDERMSPKKPFVVIPDPPLNFKCDCLLINLMKENSDRRLTPNENKCIIWGSC